MILSRLKIPSTTLAFALLAVFFIANGCSKDTDSSSDLTGNWKVSSEFEGVGRTEAVSFTVGDMVYIGLGYNGTVGYTGSERLNDFWAFQKTSGTWKRVASFPGAARNNAVAFVVDGIGYVGTGFDGTQRLSDFWAYNPTTDSWSEVADLADFGGVARKAQWLFLSGIKGISLLVTEQVPKAILKIFGNIIRRPIPGCKKPALQGLNARMPWHLFITIKHMSLQEIIMGACYRTSTFTMLRRTPGPGCVI